MGEPANPPKNMAAMSAAYNSGDPVAIAREVAVYNRQLIAEGNAPIYTQPELYTDKEPTP